MRRLGARTELELNCCCYYRTGRGLGPGLPSCHQVALSWGWRGCCYYRNGRGLRLPSCLQVACVEPELLLPYWTWSAPSFTLPGGACAAAAATTPLDEVYARWRIGWTSGSLRTCCCSSSAAGSRCTCWLSQECPAVAVSGVMLPSVPDLRRRKNRHGKKWPYTHCLQPGQQEEQEEHLLEEHLLLQLNAQEEHLLLQRTGGAPTAAAERLSCWIVSQYIRAPLRVCICVVSECAPTRHVLSASPSLAQ